MIRRLNETKWILCAAGVSYAAVLSRFYVGYFSDDARDILAARSLLSGRYADWQLPGHPPVNFPLPGFPLALAPFTLFFFHHPALLRCLPYGLTLACIPLLNALSAPWLAARARVCLLVLFAFNPTTVVASGRVMADAWFMAVMLAAFVVFQKALQKPDSRSIGWTGALAGLAAIIRPEGILLLPAIALPLLFSRARRRAGWFLLFAALAPLGVWIRNDAVTGAVSGYTTIWRASLPVLAGHYAPFLKNMAAEFAMVCAALIGGLDFNERAIPAWVWICTGAGMVLILKGFYALARDAQQETRVMAAFLLYAAGFFLLHALWLALDLHYLWPLLPLALILGVKGFASAGHRCVRGLGGILMLCLLGGYAYQYADGVRETMRKPPLCQFPQNTLQWLAQATPPNSFFLTPNAPLVSLYTHRFAMAYLEAHNEDEFRYRLLQKGITHVLLRPANFLYVQTAAGRNPNEVWAQFPAWIESAPLSFPRLYANAAEDSHVYAVRADPEFVQAFKLYMQARDAMDQGRLTDGIALLKASFGHAQLPGALNAYGIACLLNGENLDGARTALEEALRRRPQFPLAALNLARVYQRTHDAARARRYFDAARTMSLADPTANFLIPAIDREEKEM